MIMRLKIQKLKSTSSDHHVSEVSIYLFSSLHVLALTTTQNNLKVYSVNPKLTLTFLLPRDLYLSILIGDMLDMHNSRLSRSTQQF